MDLAALSALSLPDQDDRLHHLGDLWADRPVVLVFLRHFGCLHCREHAVELRDRYDDLHGAGRRARRDRHRRPALRRRVRARREDPVPRARRRRRQGRTRGFGERSRRGTGCSTRSTWRATVATWKRGHRIHSARQARHATRRDVRDRTRRRGSLQPRRRRQHRPRRHSRRARRGRCLNRRMPVKAVIFDFYGTLAETPDWGPSWQELVAELGYELPADVQRPLVERRHRRHRARRAFAVA